MSCSYILLLGIASISSHVRLNVFLGSGSAGPLQLRMLFHKRYTLKIHLGSVPWFGGWVPSDFGLWSGDDDDDDVDYSLVF